MSTRVENINKNIIEWAIVRNGNSLGDFYEQNPNVESWVKGEKKPTVNNLKISLTTFMYLLVICF